MRNLTWKCAHVSRASVRTGEAIEKSRRETTEKKRDALHWKRAGMRVLTFCRVSEHSVYVGNSICARPVIYRAYIYIHLGQQ